MSGSRKAGGSKRDAEQSSPDGPRNDAVYEQQATTAAVATDTKRPCREEDPTADGAVELTQPQICTLSPMLLQDVLSSYVFALSKFSLTFYSYHTSIYQMKKP